MREYKDAPNLDRIYLEQKARENKVRQGIESKYEDEMETIFKREVVNYGLW